MIISLTITFVIDPETKPNKQIVKPLFSHLVTTTCMITTMDRRIPITTLQIAVQVHFQLSSLLFSRCTERNHVFDRHIELITFRRLLARMSTPKSLVVLGWGCLLVKQYLTHQEISCWAGTGPLSLLGDSVEIGPIRHKSHCSKNHIAA